MEKGSYLQYLPEAQLISNTSLLHLLEAESAAVFQLQYCSQTVKSGVRNDWEHPRSSEAALQSLERLIEEQLDEAVSLCADAQVSS